MPMIFKTVGYSGPINDEVIFKDITSNNCGFIKIETSLNNIPVALGQ